MNNTLIKVAASTLALGVSLAGFSPVVQNAISNGADEAEERAARSGSQYAAEARSALGTGHPDRAVAAAERAVEAQPRSAEYRHLLGRAYLAAGRLASAETSFQDALTINPSLDRTAFNLALVQIAQGRKFDAREELAGLDGKIGASDLGLAFALAGDHERAIGILDDAARADAGNAKARQNLALAYALAGRWAEARVTAAQDISMAELDQRMRDWASFAQPANSWDQVAGLLGLDINMRDPGQPMRLALAPATPVETMVAEAPAEENPVVAFTAPVHHESYAAAPVTEVQVPAPAGAVEAPAAPLIPAASAPVRVAASAPAEAEPAEFVVEEEQTFFAENAPAPEPAAPAPEPVAPAPEPVAVSAPSVHRDETPATRPAPARIARSEAPRAPAPRDGDGRYMVQIGAFAREQNVERGWDEAVRKYGALADYEPNRADYDAGRRLYRLAFGGYDDRGAAADMCRTLRSRGVDCFVRRRAGDMPLQMAIRAAREAEQSAAAERRRPATQTAAARANRGEDDPRFMQVGMPEGMMPIEFASDVIRRIAQLV